MPCTQGSSKVGQFVIRMKLFNLPNLQRLRVSNIPSMETFSRSNLNTPLLRSVHITFVKKLRLGNLNDTISYAQQSLVCDFLMLYAKIRQI